MSNFRKASEDALVSVSVDLQRVEGGGEGLSELSVFVWDRVGKVPRTETVQVFFISLFLSLLLIFNF